MAISIPKAIEILIPFTIPPDACPDPDTNDAIKLGIEALKLVQEGRTKPGGQFFHDLPGETMD